MTKARISVRAPAKINLTLHVTGQRPDGYHLLDSVVVFADVADQITVTPADGLSLTIDGPEGRALTPDDNNLVLRAARFLDPSRGAEIRLTKMLPVASGIGGGSADAAATLRALARLWSVPLPEPLSTTALGADVPVCLTGHSCRMQGIGETLSPPIPLPPLDILLVNPRVAVPTPAIFKSLACRTNPPMSGPPPCDLSGLQSWLAAQRNDLTKPAITLAPEIATVLDTLSSQMPLHSGMSGSGATCFALFPKGDPRLDHAAEHITATHPDWWCAAAPLL